MTVATHKKRRISRLWQAAQLVSVAVALGIVVLLVVRPEWGLFATWNVLIPVVPALLLVAPGIWRNLCPIAVVHQLPVVLGRGGGRRLSGRAQWWAPAVAGGAFFLIVPLRHALFNEHGPALAAFVVVVLSVALAGGFLFAGKSGWCSTFCPVGPVEKLYGQQPFAPVPHAHCASCVGCTDACFDRDGPPAVGRLLGEDVDPEGLNSGGAAGLLRTPTGVFAAAFPGFVLGYFTADPGAALGAIYLHVALTAAASSVILAALHGRMDLSVRSSVRLAAAAGVGLYYGFTVPAVIEATEVTFQMGPVPGWVSVVGRVALLGLAAVWLLDAPRRERAVSHAPR